MSTDERNDGGRIRPVKPKKGSGRKRIDRVVASIMGVKQPKWFIEMAMSVELLRSGVLDFDKILLDSAPEDAVGPHKILTVKAVPSEYDGIVVFKALIQSAWRK